MTDVLTYTATCLFGLEALLGAEIDALGYRRISTIDGRVTFEGDESAVARANMQLRYAERLYVNLGEFDAPTFTALFDGTAALPWEDFIGESDAFPVKGHAIKSALSSIPDCQKIVKKAIASRLGKLYGMQQLPETGVKYQIEFFILKDRASLMIDTSGTPLHKRGYRPETVAAPLRETLAAAVAALSRPREDVLFRDPFCGSGTIAIEAAMQMLHIAPGAHRTFAAEAYPRFAAPMWQAAREEAADLVIRDSAFEAFASDIDPECVRIAMQSAERAGVAAHIRVETMNALDIVTEDRRGTIVTNPPYGERLMTESEAEELYRQMGRAFSRLGRWQIYVLTPCETFERLYGRRADKVRKLYNGMIPCRYYQFFKNPR